MNPAYFVHSHSGRYFMPAVQLFVVADSKASLGRRSAASKFILLRSWWVWKVAIARISCRTELLPLTVPNEDFFPPTVPGLPDDRRGCAALPRPEPRPTGSELVGLLEAGELGGLPLLAEPESLQFPGIVPACFECEFPL